MIFGCNRLRRDEHVLRRFETSELMEGLAEQQADLWREPVDARGAAESFDLGEVMPVPSQSSGLQQQRGVGGPRCLEASGRDANRILATTCAISIDAVGMVEEQAPPREGRHPSAHDLAVKRVRQRHLLPAPVGVYCEEARSIERLERLASHHGLDDSETGGLPHRQDVESSLGLRVECAEPVGNELVQARRRDERASEAPHSPLVAETATVDRAEHELPDKEHVALAGRPDLARGARLDRASEHKVEQRVDRRPVEIAEIDATHAGAMPERFQAGGHWFGRSDGGDQEDEVGIDELRDERRRRLVERVEVVDEQHERSVRCVREQHRTDRGDHRDQVASLVPEVGRQQVRQRAERRVSSASGRRRASDATARFVSDREALIREPGLADTGRSVDHQTMCARVGQRCREHLELLVPSHEWPLQWKQGHRWHRIGPCGRPG